MNLQKDIRRKAFYAKELPETFPVNKTIRQHYVSQKYALDAFSSQISLEAWSKIADVIGIWQAIAEPFVISCHPSLLYYTRVWWELRKVNSLFWNKTLYQISSKNSWGSCILGNWQQFYVHNLKNARWDVKVNVGVFARYGGYSSQKIFSVSKVVKIINRKFRDTQLSKHGQAK